MTGPLPGRKACTFGIRKGTATCDFLGATAPLTWGTIPAVAAALEAVGEMPNLLQASLNPLAGALAYNLAQITPGDLRQTFFCNSGAEAVEGALKTARIATGKTKIIYCDGAFHGKSMGALSVTGRKKYQHGFTPLVPGCESVPYGDLAALRKAGRRRCGRLYRGTHPGGRGHHLSPGRLP